MKMINKPVYSATMCTALCLVMVIYFQASTDTVPEVEKPGSLTGLFADSYLKESIHHLIHGQPHAASGSRWSLVQACMDLGMSHHATAKYAGVDAWFDASVKALEALERIVFSVSNDAKNLELVDVANHVDSQTQSDVKATLKELIAFGRYDVKQNTQQVTAWLNTATKEVVAFQVETSMSAQDDAVDPLLVVGFPSMLERLNFYTIDGSPWRDQFLDLTPLGNAFPISSRFNPSRRHPVTGVVRPHNGIDFATPVGTPIYAQADGSVERASRNRRNGYYLKVNYGHGIDGLYLHLNRFARDVRTGRSVKKGELIGYTGNTGLTTGPHLHYELHVNGTPINPPDIALFFDPDLPENMNEIFFSWASVMDQMMVGGEGSFNDGRHNRSPMMLSMRESIPELQGCLEKHNDSCAVNLF